MPHPWLALPICLAIAGAMACGTADASLVLPAQDRCQVAGPFATVQRAIEAAQVARERGATPTTYRANGGYFVLAC